MRWRGITLFAGLWFATGAVTGADAGLRAQLTDLQEMARFTPDRALPLIPRLEEQAKTGTMVDRSDVVALSCDIRHRLGRNEEALPLCELALSLGRQAGDNDAVVRAMLYKSYVVFGLGKVADSHALVWEAEKLGAASRDPDVRVRAALAAGQAFAEDGNFPAAVARVQAAVTTARASGSTLLRVISLDELAYLYNQTRQSDKAFGTLDEAISLARQLDSPARLASLRSTEYALAMDAGQTRRGLEAMLEAVEIQRRMGADGELAGSLVNLSDCYLKLHDYPTALAHAQQALALGSRLHDEGTIAVARLNIGQIYLATGRVAEGKQSMEQGMALYEKAGNKPELQGALTEYGAALERAGDFVGALRAYHRERVLSNELFEERRQKAVATLQEKYEAGKKQREIELLQRENQVKSTELINRRLQGRIWWLLALVFALAAVIVGILYRRVRIVNELLEVRNSELKQQSVRDPLTGLYNRRHFQEFMHDYRQVDGRRNGEGGAVVGALFLLDVDHFKQINDRHGHAAGDAVLRDISSALREILRETDMIVRWGGEEFLAFLPAVDRTALDDVARRLLCDISARTIQHAGAALSVNVSIGFAPFPLAPGNEAMTWERAVNLVDMALYLAKGHGRNRAYGIRRVDARDGPRLDEIEQDIERAWRAGRVDLSVVQCGQDAAPPAASASR